MLQRKKVYIAAKDLQKDDGTYTTSEVETNEYLLQKYFPEDDPQHDMDGMREIQRKRMERK